MKSMRLFLIGASLLYLSGCVIYYQPIDSYPVETIMDFSSTSSFTLINGQPSKKLVSFYGSLYANLNAWTDVAMSIAERELKKRGLNSMKDSPKSITMTIESAEIGGGTWSWVVKTKIVMNVKTSDGYSATYTGNDMAAAFFRPKAQMDKAMMRVVVAMLNDPQIVSFLREE